MKKRLKEIKGLIVFIISLLLIVSVGFFGINAQSDGSVCGDGICSSPEIIENCLADCGGNICQDVKIPGVTFSCIKGITPYGVSGDFVVSYAQYTMWLSIFGKQYSPQDYCGCSWYGIKLGVPWEKLSCPAKTGCDYSKVPDTLPRGTFNDYCGNVPEVDPVELSSRLAKGESYEEAYQNTIENEKRLIMIYLEERCVRGKVYYIGGETGSANWMCKGDKYRLNPEVAHADWQKFVNGAWTSNFLDDCGTGPVCGDGFCNLKEKEARDCPVDCSIKKCIDNLDCLENEICNQEQQCIDKGQCRNLANGAYGYMQSIPFDFSGDFTEKNNHCKHDIFGNPTNQAVIYSCADDKETIISKTISCPTGCNDLTGNCNEDKSSTEPEKPSACIDSDEINGDSKQPNTKGVASDGFTKYIDKCLDKTHLLEWYCYSYATAYLKNLMHSPVATTYKCSGKCSNGKCDGNAEEVMTEKLCKSTGILDGDVVIGSGVWKNNMCLCSAGSCPLGWECSPLEKTYFSGYSGYCVPDNKPNDEDCIKEGEKIKLESSEKCCENLETIQPSSVYSNELCLDNIADYRICAPCGNGKCDSPIENKCNCAEDCLEPEVFCPAIAYSCPNGLIAETGPNCEILCNNEEIKDKPPIYCILIKKSCPDGSEPVGYVGCTPVCEEESVGEIGIIERSIKDCIKITGEDALYFNGLQGGYYEPPENAFKVEFGSFVPYSLPNKIELEKQLALYVDDKLKECLIFVNTGEPEVSYNSPKTQVIINPSDVSFIVENPLKTKKGSEYIALGLKSLHIKVDSKFYDMYKLAKYIEDSQNSLCMSCLVKMADEKKLLVDFVDFEDKINDVKDKTEDKKNTRLVIITDSDYNGEGAFNFVFLEKYENPKDKGGKLITLPEQKA